MKRERRIVLGWVASVLLVVGYAPPATAQSEVGLRGQVVSAADGAAVASAVVTLTPVEGEGVPQETVADARGQYHFTQLRPGIYSLSAVAAGVGAQTVPVTLLPRETRTVTLALEATRLALGVRVEGQVVPPTTRSPSSTVLTATRLADVPASQQASLPETLVTLAPGMIRSHDDFVHVRGHEVALNPVINGVSFWENPHALFSPGLRPAVIDTATVMTGGFPAEYGNRFGGVVDIVTKSGFRLGNTGSAMLVAGQADRRSAQVDFGGQHERVGYYLLGAFASSGRYLSPPDPKALHDDGRDAHLFVQLDTNLGRAGLLRAVLMGDGANVEMPRTPQDAELRPLALASQRTRQQTAILGWTRASASTALHVSGYQRWSEARLLPASGPLTASASARRELATVGGKVDVMRFAGAHAVKVGVDAVRLRPEEDIHYQYGGYRALAHILELPHLHVHGSEIAFADARTGGQVSAYVQDTVAIGNRLTVDLGARLDHYSLVTTATHVSPRVNAALTVGAATVVHASYNHFFVPPPIEGVLSSSAGLTAAIQEIGFGLPALAPTTEHQVELGVSAPVGPVTLAVTGYSRWTENPVHTTVWPDARLYSYASFDRERAYGLETKADVPGLRQYGLTGYVNYALGRVAFFNPVTGGFVTEPEHLGATTRFLAPMDQTHTLTAGGTYRPLRGPAWVGATVEHGSGTPMTHGAAHEHGDHAEPMPAPDQGTARVPAHTTANLSLGVDVLRGADRRPRLTLRVDVENLSGRQHVIAQESEFSPGQYSIPRVIAVAATVHF